MGNVTVQGEWATLQCSQGQGCKVASLELRPVSQDKHHA